MSRKAPPTRPVFKTIRTKRFKEINSRLRKISSEDVREFLYKSGFFPENQYLPNDYFDSRDLASFLKFNGLSQVGELEMRPHEKPAFLFYPKSKFVLRTLGIPAVVNHIALSNLIALEWAKVKAHLSLKPSDLIIPYTYPLFYKDENRSGIAISNHKVLWEQDMPQVAAHYNFCVFLDIKNFYGSIYTHSIAWALDPKTVHRKNCGCDLKKRIFCTSHNKGYFPNKLDRLTSKQNQNRTKGILLGPVTSDLVSEILLRTVDRKISSFIKEKSYTAAGFRYKDDYVFFADSYKEADRIRMKAQHLLSEFHLDVNEQKTKICESDEIEDKKAWKVETDELRAEIENAIKRTDPKKRVELKEKDLIIWLRKTGTLYKTYEDPYIIKTVWGALTKPEAIRIRQNIRESKPFVSSLEGTNASILASMSQLSKKEPSTWPLFIGFLCLVFEGSNKKVKVVIGKILKNYIEDSIESDHSFSLIWNLYAAWRCKISIGDNLKKKITKTYSGNWVVTSLVKNKAKSFQIGKIRYSVVKREQKTRKPLNQVLAVFSSGGY